MNHNFMALLQLLKSFADLVSTEVRFAKNGLSWHEPIRGNFGANAKIDIVRRAGACSKQFALRRGATFASIAIWIEDNSASDGVLFRRVAKNKSIASKRKYGQLQF